MKQCRRRRADPASRRAGSRRGSPSRSSSARESGSWRRPDRGNSASLSHWRRVTTSSRSMAMCAAGPPKAVTPSLSATCATSATPSGRDARGVTGVGGRVLAAPETLSSLVGSSGSMSPRMEHAMSSHEISPGRRRQGRALKPALAVPRCRCSRPTCGAVGRRGIDKPARRVYVHGAPNVDGSNPGSGRHSRRRRGSRASAELVGVLLCRFTAVAPCRRAVAPAAKRR